MNTHSIKEKCVRFCWHWLPIFFGCHCRPDRSFFFRGIQFPICARCTGMLAGMLLFPASAWAWRPNGWGLLAMTLPMVIDGGVQRATRYESTNPRRCWTGLLGGYALVGLLWLLLLTGFSHGRSLGALLRGGPG